MADTEYLKTFVDGESILATDTNNNNEYLLNKITDSSGALTTYVDNKISGVDSSISSLTTSLNDKVSSLSTSLTTQINSVKTTANSKLSATQSLALNGWCKLSNGWKVQWGQFTPGSRTTTVRVTFPSAFASTSYQLAFSSNYHQWRGDKGSSCAYAGKYTTGFDCFSAFEESTPVVSYIAVGK